MGHHSGYFWRSIPTSNPQLPELSFKTLQIPSNGDHKARDRGTLEGAERKTEVPSGSFKFNSHRQLQDLRTVRTTSTRQALACPANRGGTGTARQCPLSLNVGLDLQNARNNGPQTLFFWVYGPFCCVLWRSRCIRATMMLGTCYLLTAMKASSSSLFSSASLFFVEDAGSFEAL